MGRVRTRDVASRDEVATHFDGIARDYREAHGPAQRLLEYRLRVLRRRLGTASPEGVLLEIGCGTGIHLLPLARGYGRALGTDLSAAMVDVARERAAALPWGDRVEARTDPAEELATVADASVDAAFCVGALEHMWDRPRVFAQVRRVLRPRGRFVCLTPNGGWIWFRRLAPRLGVAVRHLSTDRFLTAGDLAALAAAAGLAVESCDPWTFIPRGDMPRPWTLLLRGLDQLGRLTGSPSLRGGLALTAVRPSTSS